MIQTCKCTRASRRIMIFIEKPSGCYPCHSNTPLELLELEKSPSQAYSEIVKCITYIAVARYTVLTKMCGARLSLGAPLNAALTKTHEYVYLEFYSYSSFMSTCKWTRVTIKL